MSISLSAICAEMRYELSTFYATAMRRLEI